MKGLNINVLILVFLLNHCGNVIWFTDAKQKEQQQRNSFLALLGLNTKDGIRPKVVSIKPENASVNVSIDPQIEVEFDKDMDPNTITSTNLFIIGVNSMVQYSGRIARITPNPLAPNKEYTVKISQNAMDLSGNRLAQEYTSTFTTGTSISNTSNQLSIASIFPADGAIGVSLTTSIAVSFTKEINPGTLSNSSFRLFQGTTQIAANTSPVGKIGGVLYPLAALQPNTTYTIKISTAVTDNSSPPVALPSEFTSTFTTGSSTSSNLLVTGTSPVAGATQVSVNSKIIVVMDRALDPSTVNTTNITLQNTGSVAGTVSMLGTNGFVFSPTNPLPPNTVHTLTVTTGVLDTGVPPNSLSANYSFTFTTGNTVLNPNAPTVTSVLPANSSTSVSTTPTIVIQFSEPMNPSTINTTNIILKQGMTPIPRTVQLVGDSTAVLTPNSSLSHSTTYTVEVGTGVQDASTPPDNLASTFTSTFTTGSSYTTNLSVAGTNPSPGATQVSVNSKIIVVMDRALDPSTVNTTNITLQNTGSVAGTVSMLGTNSFVFTPTNPLPPNTVHTLTVTTGVLDTAVPPNSLSANYSFTFTTGNSIYNPNAPTIVSTVPTNSATGVSITPTIAIKFSEPMNSSTINTTNIILRQGVTPVSRTVSLIGYDTAIVIPTVNLNYNTVYTIEVTTGVQDISSPPSNLAATYTSTFTTQSYPTLSVSGVYPTNGGTNIPLNATMSVTFSNPMNVATINTTNVTLTQLPSTPVTGTITMVGTQSFQFIPSTMLSPSVSYSFQISSAVQDTYGGSISGGYTVIFSTANSEPDSGSVTTLAGGIPAAAGYVNATGTSARFNFPRYISMNMAENYALVTDTSNHAVRQVTYPTGVVTTFAGAAPPATSGFVNGTGTAARFNSPRGIARSVDEFFFITDTGNNGIRRLTTGQAVTMFTPNVNTAGFVVNSAWNVARFNAPQGLYYLFDLTVGASVFIVSDTLNHTIRKVRMSDGFSYTNFVGSVAPTPSPSFIDGLGTATRFNSPAGVAIDSTGVIYVTDTANHVIRRITQAGQVTTIAGNPTVSGYQNGSGTSALFNNPTGIAVGPGNVLYVTDTGNCAIRKIVVNDLGTVGTVTTFAGGLPPTPSCDYVNSTRLNSRFNQPVGLYVMGNGRVLVTDTNNHAIRMIVP